MWRLCFERTVIRGLVRYAPQARLLLTARSEAASREFAGTHPSGVNRGENMRNISNAALGILSIVMAVACGKSNDRPASTPDTTGTAPGTATENGAVTGAATGTASEAIAQSRCDREARCNNVGADRKYSSATDCLARIREEWREDLSARECPSGVNRSQLDECLSKIRGEDCGSPFDTLSRLSECTAGQICDD
jgi:hypothetical protein